MLVDESVEEEFNAAMFVVMIAVLADVFASELGVPDVAVCVDIRTVLLSLTLDFCQLNFFSSLISSR